MLNHKYSQRLSRLLFFILLCQGSLVWSTTIVQLELQDMAHQSDLIIVSHCTAIESVWVGRTLFTRYTMAVEETVDGEKNATVQVMVRGGIDLNRPVPIAVSVAGAPLFFPDERDVLLLKQMRHPHLTNTYSIVGFNQGRFKIKNGVVPAQKQVQQQRAADVPVARLVDKLRLLVKQPRRSVSPKNRIFLDLNLGEVRP